MAMPLPHSLSPATCKDAFKRYKASDNKPGDADGRPDFVLWSNGEQKIQVALNAHGFLARQMESGQVRVTTCRLPRFFGEGTVETICRTAQGAYSGFLGGVEIAPDLDSQERARKSYYEWQKPLNTGEG